MYPTETSFCSNWSSLGRDCSTRIFPFALLFLNGAAAATRAREFQLPATTDTPGYRGARNRWSFGSDSAFQKFRKQSPLCAGLLRDNTSDHLPRPRFSSGKLYVTRTGSREREASRELRRVSRAAAIRGRPPTPSGDRRFRKERLAPLPNRALFAPS